MPDTTAEDVTIQEVIEPDFEVRRDKLVAMMSEDSAIRDQMLAEIYIFISDFDRSMRTMAANGGPKAMIKAMLSGGLG